MQCGSATSGTLQKLPNLTLQSTLQSPSSISTFATFNVKSNEATLLLRPCMLLGKLQPVVACHVQYMAKISTFQFTG